MSAPHLPQVPPALRRVGPGRVRVGRVGPRLMLRGALVGLALVVLVVLLAGCGNPGPAAVLPAPAPPSTTAPAPPAPATSAPTTEPTTRTGPPAATEESDRPAPSGRAAPTAPPAPSAPAAPAAQPARPLWPATDAASARTLQQQVDRGGEPWLLDPEEVAVSYAGVELGYRDPTVVVLAPGRVDLQDGRSRAQALVTLQQTVREGPGGIWLVTRVERR